MTRPHVAVRDARHEDLPGLLAMWDELRAMDSRLERLVPSTREAAITEHLDIVITDPGSRAIVATIGDEVVGMAMLSVGPYAPLVDQRAVHAHYLHVRDGFRRRGVGTALLAAAVSFAEESGAEHVLTNVLTHQRDTQRFYARLGFGPVAVRRSVPVAVLRRRLFGGAAASVSEHLVAHRRSLRRVRAAVARAVD